MNLYDPRIAGRSISLATHNQTLNLKQIKMKWLGNTGKILTMSASGENSGRSIQIWDMRALN